MGYRHYEFERCRSEASPQTNEAWFCDTGVRDFQKTTGQMGRRLLGIVPFFYLLDEKCWVPCNVEFLRLGGMKTGSTVL